MSSWNSFKNKLTLRPLVDKYFIAGTFFKFNFVCAVSLFITFSGIIVCLVRTDSPYRNQTLIQWTFFFFVRFEDKWG